MPIKECCNIGVVCCTQDTPITEVAGLMRKHHVGDVIVIEEKDGTRLPLGIVTDRDIVLETVSVAIDARIFTAGDIMSKPLVSVQENAGFVETLRLMRHHKVRRMPVITAEGTLYGVVTADDIMNLLAMELSLMSAAVMDQPAKESKLRRELGSSV